VSLSSDQSASLDEMDFLRFWGVFGSMSGSEVVDHSDPLLGETSLLDGAESSDELGGPILNMVAVLCGEKMMRKVVVLSERESCECAGRDVVVAMMS
jgi:hypothetical protein